MADDIFNFTLFGLNDTNSSFTSTFLKSNATDNLINSTFFELNETDYVDLSSEAPISTSEVLISTIGEDDISDGLTTPKLVTMSWVFLGLNYGLIFLVFWVYCVRSIWKNWKKQIFHSRQIWCIILIGILTLIIICISSTLHLLSGNVAFKMDEIQIGSWLNNSIDHGMQIILFQTYFIKYYLLCYEYHYKQAVLAIEWKLIPNRMPHWNEWIKKNKSTFGNVYYVSLVSYLIGLIFIITTTLINYYVNQSIWFGIELYVSLSLWIAYTVIIWKLVSNLALNHSVFKLRDEISINLAISLYACLVLLIFIFILTSSRSIYESRIFFRWIKLFYYELFLFVYGLGWFAVSTLFPSKVGQNLHMTEPTAEYRAQGLSKTKNLSPARLPIKSHISENSKDTDATEIEMEPIILGDTADSDADADDTDATETKTNNDNDGEEKKKEEEAGTTNLLAKTSLSGGGADAHGIEYMTNELNDLFFTKEGTRAFVLHLLLELSVENLMFLVDLMAFKRSIVIQTKIDAIKGWRMTFPDIGLIPMSTKASDKIHERMQFLYETYITKHAVLKICLLKRTRDTLKSKFDAGDATRNSEPTRCMMEFEEVAREVSQLLLQSFERFRNTPAYVQWKDEHARST